MSKTRLVWTGIIGFIGTLILAFILNLGELQWNKFFKPKFQNVERKVFEETQSYVHGKIQELGRLYQQYQEAKAPEDKAAIKELVRMQFTDFDAEKIDNYKLKSFLLEMRGY
jgi:hypothetical protein